MLQQNADLSGLSTTSVHDVDGSVDGVSTGTTNSAPKSKKELRKERKKRKLLALSAVMLLNEQEGNHGKNQHSEQDPQHATEANGIPHGSDPRMQQILIDNRTAFAIGEPEAEATTENGVKRRKGTDNDNSSAIKSERLCGGASTHQDKRKSPPEKATHDAEEEYRTLKAYVNKRKTMHHVPRILLKPDGRPALLDRKQNEERIPLLLDDIQTLLMHTLLRMDSPTTPRWCTIEKSAKLTHTVVLILEGFSCEKFVTYREHMPTCKTRLFGSGNTFQVVCPSAKIVEELACVPLSDTHKDILVAEYGSLETAMRVCKDQMLVRKSIFRNIDRSGTAEVNGRDLAPGDKFPRTLLLLSPIQMINEGFPLPLTGTLQNRYKDYVTTSDVYKPVTPRSPMFGVDCEMCGAVGNLSVLTRVSIVNESGEVVYNELVKPTQQIVNYRTPFSGITPEMLRNVTKRLVDVQRDLRRLLPPDAILVGHSLNSDLEAMQMMHPYVIDTSIVYNVSGNPNHKHKLRILAKKYLNKDIQCSTEGHNSIEDCAASLDLVKLKLANSIYFGDQWLEDRRNYHSFMAANRVGIAKSSADPGPIAPGATDQEKQAQITSTLFSHAKQRNKRSLIVTNADEELRTFEAYFGKTIQPSDRKASQKWLSFVKTDSANATVQQMAADCLQYDFNLAYVKLPPGTEAASSDDQIAQTVQIDDWVKRVYNSLSLNGLFVVLLVGSEEQPRAHLRSAHNRIAVAMVQTKTNSTTNKL